MSISLLVSTTNFYSPLSRLLFKSPLLVIPFPLAFINTEEPGTFLAFATCKIALSLSGFETTQASTKKSNHPS